MGLGFAHLIGLGEFPDRFWVPGRHRDIKAVYGIFDLIIHILIHLGVIYVGSLLLDANRKYMVAISFLHELAVLKLFKTEVSVK